MRRYDDDCDGNLDEDYEAVDVTCGQGACRAAGTLECIDGIEESNCEPRPPPPR